MDDELNKIVDTYYEDAPIIDTNEDSLETYNEVEIRRSTDVRTMHMILRGQAR